MVCCHFIDHLLIDCGQLCCHWWAFRKRSALKFFSCYYLSAFGSVVSVFVAVRAFSQGLSSSFSCQWLLLWSTSSRCTGFCRGSTWAQLLRGTWDLPGPGIEPVSSALAGGFLTREALSKHSCPLCSVWEIFMRTLLKKCSVADSMPV